MHANLMLQVVIVDLVMIAVLYLHNQNAAIWCRTLHIDVLVRRFARKTTSIHMNVPFSKVCSASDGSQWRHSSPRRRNELPWLSS